MLITKEQFDLFWDAIYPGVLPISYTFKHNYPNRWLRIHSLPGSKRYPSNDSDWTILFNRQNTIITDIIGNDAKIVIVTGDYFYEGLTELHPIEAVTSIKAFSFFKLDEIDLHKIYPEQYESGQFYRPIFCTEFWQNGKFNDVLKDIAEDQLRAFFISIDKECIIAPYDGGIDILLRDTDTRDKCKLKYKDWLSEREDGM